MLLAGIGIGFIPFAPGVGIVGGSSAAISAACHPPLAGEDDGKRMAIEKVQWGVGSTDEDGVGHCAFLNGKVGHLEVGEMYR